MTLFSHSPFWKYKEASYRVFDPGRAIVPASHYGGPGSRPTQSVWALWWTLGQDFLRVLPFSPVSIISKLFHIHSCIICGMHKQPKETQSVPITTVKKDSQFKV
jgi:hypothetical protein